MLRIASNRKEKIALIASYIVGIIIIAILLHFVGYDRVLLVISRMSVQFFLLTLLLDLAGLVFYALTWHILLKGLRCDVKFKTSLSVSLASIFTCYVTPSGVLLELVRVALINREAKVPIGKGAAAVVMHRILYTLGFILCAIVSYIALYGEYTAPRAIELIILMSIVASLIFALVIFYLSQRADILERIANKIFSLIEDRIQKTLKKYESISLSESFSEVVNDFRNAFIELKSNSIYLFMAFIMVVVTWIADIAIFYVVFISLNYPIPIWIAALTIVIGDFIQMTPIMIPGMLGILETVFTTALTSFGIPMDIAASAAILARIATFWFDIPVTAIAASYYGFKYLIKGVEAIS